MGFVCLIMKGKVEYIKEGSIFHGEIPYVMGTRFELLAVGVSEEKMMEIWDVLCLRAFNLDKMLNRFDDQSEVSNLNMLDNPLEMQRSSELDEIVNVANHYYEMTLGLFDIVSYDGKLDFGGIAKGYFLRICNELLRSKDVKCAFMDFGNSSILGIGSHPYGDAWKVGIIEPYTRKAIGEVSLVDRAMSTSGNSPQYSSHIRNPRNGESCKGRKLVTVLSDDPLDAEVLSTALILANEDEKKTILSNFPDAELAFDF